MRLKYLTKLTEQDLLAVATKLGFEHQPEGFLKGTDVSVSDSFVSFHSYNHNFSNKDDYETSTLVLTDFEVVGTDYSSSYKKQRQMDFVKLMAEKFKDTNYKVDLLKYIYNKKQQQKEELLLQIQELEEDMSHSEKALEELEQLVK